MPSYKIMVARLSTAAVAEMDDGGGRPLRFPTARAAEAYCRSFGARRLKRGEWSPAAGVIWLVRPADDPKQDRPGPPVKADGERKHKASFSLSRAAIDRLDALAVEQNSSVSAALEKLLLIGEKIK